MENNIVMLECSLWNLYQANPEWMVWVKINDFNSEKEANVYEENSFWHLHLIDNELCLINIEDNTIIKKFIDSEVRIEEQKPESKGKSMMYDEDYEIKIIKISDFRNYPGLLTGFSSLGYEIKPISI